MMPPALFLLPLSYALRCFRHIFALMLMAAAASAQRDVYYARHAAASFSLRR